MVDNRATSDQEPIKQNSIISSSRRDSENVNTTNLTTMNLNNNSHHQAADGVVNDVQNISSNVVESSSSQINSTNFNSSTQASTINSNCSINHNNSINLVQSSSFQPNNINITSGQLNPQASTNLAINPTNLINNTLASDFALHQNNLASSTATTTINLSSNKNTNLTNKLINGTNQTISISNQPILNPVNIVAASCPANNLINQTPIQISQSMNTANSVPNNIVSTSNVELQDDDSEDESEILEESPCGRWLKRREEVEQRDIPGIDATFLAMDTEEGVEVVWNEARFSEKKYFNSKEETIREVFDRLILLNHPNIVKLYTYWIDKDSEKARIIFITEYMSSGSVKLFLKKTKKNEIKMSLGTWNNWCKQLLSALCYLHSSVPPIIHENLTCDTIFISHNGNVKMSAVAPNSIHQHIKTFTGDSIARDIYLVAPEIMNATTDDINNVTSVLSTAVDIYSFGICALEMAALEITNGESQQITKETVEKTIESLDNDQQKDFIRKCLAENPTDRPTAKELLFHPVIFEVPSLALFAAHSILNNSPSYQLTDETFLRNFNNLNDDTIVAEINHPDGRPSVIRRISDIPLREVEKFFEEVRNGAYPLTAIFPPSRQPIVSRQPTISPEPSGNGSEQKSLVPENPYNEENRKIVNMMCNIKAPQENENLMMTLLLRLDDKMNRQLSCEITDIESPICLANELVYYGFINQSDRDMVAALINDTISRTQYTKSDTSASVTLHTTASMPTATTSMPTTA